MNACTPTTRGSLRFIVDIDVDAAAAADMLIPHDDDGAEIDHLRATLRTALTHIAYDNLPERLDATVTVHG